jgi:hypothetical protein
MLARSKTIPRSGLVHWLEGALDARLRVLGAPRSPVPGSAVETSRPEDVKKCRKIIFAI